MSISPSQSVYGQADPAIEPIQSPNVPRQGAEEAHSSRGAQLIAQIEEIKKNHLTPTWNSVGTALRFKATMQNVDVGFFSRIWRAITFQGTKREFKYPAIKKDLESIEEQIVNLKKDLPDFFEDSIKGRFDSLNDELKNFANRKNSLSYNEEIALKDVLTNYMNLLNDVNNVFMSQYSSMIRSLEDDLKQRIIAHAATIELQGNSDKAKDAEISKLEKTITDLKNELEDYKKQSESLKKENDQLKEEIEVLKQKYAKAEGDLKAAQERIKQLEQERDNKDSEIKEKNNQIALLKNLLEQSEQRNEEYQQQISSLTASVETLTQQKDELRKEVAQLREELKISRQENAEAFVNQGQRIQELEKNLGEAQEILRRHAARVDQSEDRPAAAAPVAAARDVAPAPVATSPTESLLSGWVSWGAGKK